MDFYQVFIEMRNKKGVAPSRAALDIGLSKTAVNGWKVKHSTPTDATIAKLADYFGIAVDDFNEKMGIKKAPAGNSDEGKEFEEIFSQLNEKNKFKSPLSHHERTIENAEKVSKFSGFFVFI